MMLLPNCVRNFAEEYRVTFVRSTPGDLGSGWYVGRSGFSFNPSTQQVAAPLADRLCENVELQAWAFHEVAHIACFLPEFPKLPPEELFLLQFEERAAERFGLDRAAYVKYRSVTPLASGLRWSETRDPEGQPWWAEGWLRAERLGLLPLTGRYVDPSRLTAHDRLVLSARA